MLILFVRHGKAGGPGTKRRYLSEGHDDERPLTKKGKSEMRDVSEKLAKMYPMFQRVVSSPFARAQQTAKSLAAAYGIKKVEMAQELLPVVDREDFFAWLLKQKKSKKNIIVVGHEPHLSEVVCWLMSGRPQRFMAFKKGGAALLSAKDHFKPGDFQLHWLVNPGFLR